MGKIKMETGVVVMKLTATVYRGTIREIQSSRTHYYLIPKNLVYYQVRLSLWICLQRSTSTPFNGLFRQSAALSLLRLHVTP